MNSMRVGLRPFPLHSTHVPLIPLYCTATILIHLRKESHKILTSHIPHRTFFDQRGEAPLAGSPPLYHPLPPLGGQGGYLTWRVVTVTRHHIMQRDFKIIEKSAMWDVRCQYFVRFFSQVYKSGGRTVQLYQRYVSAVKREGPEPNPHTVHGTVVDFSESVLWSLCRSSPDRRTPPGGG